MAATSIAATTKRLLRPDDRVKTNGSRRGSNQATPKAHAGLDSHGAGRVVRRSSAEAELIDLPDRFVGSVFERDAVMRTIPTLHKDSPRTPQGLKPNNALRR